MVTNRQTRQAEESAKHRHKRRRICASVLFAALATAVLGAGQATADDFDIPRPPPGLDLGDVQNTLPAAGGELARGLLDPGQQAALGDALDAVAAVAADAPIAPLNQFVTWTQRSIPDPTPGPVHELLAFAQQATELAGARRDNSISPVDHLIDQTHTLFGFPEDGPDPVAGLRTLLTVPAVGQEDSIARPLPSGLRTIAAPVLGVFAAPVGGGVPALAFLAPLLTMAANPAAAIGVVFTQFRDTLGAPASDIRRPAAVEFSVGAVLTAVPLLLIGGAAAALAIGEVLLGAVLIAGPALAVAAGALIAFADVAIPVALAVAGTLALPALLLGGLLVAGVGEVLAVLTAVGLLDVVGVLVGGVLVGGVLVGLSTVLGAGLFAVTGGVLAALTSGLLAVVTGAVLAAVTGGVLAVVEGAVLAALTSGLLAAVVGGVLAAVAGGVLLAVLALPVILAAAALIVVVGAPLALLGLLAVLAIPLLLLGAAAVAVLLDPGARGAVVSAIRAALDRNCPQGNSGMAPTGTHFLDDVPDDPNSDQLVAALQRMLAPQPRPEPVPCPAPSQGAESRSCPAPEPRSCPAPELRSFPAPEPQLSPTPEPRPSPAPEPRACPAPVEPQPSPTPEPQPSPAPEPQPSPVPEPRSCPTPEPRPCPIPEPQACPAPVEPRPSPRPAPQPCPDQIPAPRSCPEPRPAPSQVPAPQSNPAPCPRLCPAPRAPGRSANCLPRASRPISRPVSITAVLIDPVGPSDLFRKFSMS
ncbi:hypothetical protein ACWIGW_31960 [Nocardia brasiliensis]